MRSQNRKITLSCFLFPFPINRKMHELPCRPSSLVLSHASIMEMISEMWFKSPDRVLRSPVTHLTSAILNCDVPFGQRPLSLQIFALKHQIHTQFPSESSRSHVITFSLALVFHNPPSVAILSFMNTTCQPSHPTKSHE